MAAIRGTVPYSNNSQIQVAENIKEKDTQPDAIQLVDDCKKSVELNKNSIIEALLSKCKEYGLENDSFYSLITDFVNKNVKEDIVTQQSYDDAVIKFTKYLMLCSRKVNGTLKADDLRLYIQAAEFGLSVDDIKDIEKNNSGKKLNTDDEIKNIIELNKKDPTEAKKQLINLILNSSDTEKVKLLPVVLTVYKDSKDTGILNYFFSTFQTKDNARECAENIDAKTLREGCNSESRKFIFKIMSEQAQIDHVKAQNADFAKFYDENCKAVEQILLLRKKGEDIPQEYSSIAAQYDKYMAPYTDYAVSASNRNVLEAVHAGVSISEGVKEDFINNVAEYVKDPNNKTMIPMDEFVKIFDEFTEGKFSQVLEKLPEKSAYDQEKSEMKTIPQEAAIAAKEKAEQLTAQITPKQEGFVIEKPEQAVEDNKTSKNSKQTFIASNKSLAFNFEFFSFSDMTTDKVEDFFKGKYKETSQYIFNIALNGYKRLGITEQGNILKQAAGKYLAELVVKTDENRLIKLLNAGWKGNCYASTKKVEKIAEEKKKESA